MPRSPLFLVGRLAACHCPAPQPDVHVMIDALDALEHLLGARRTDDLAGGQMFSKRFRAIDFGDKPRFLTTTTYVD